MSVGEPVDERRGADDMLVAAATGSIGGEGKEGHGWARRVKSAEPSATK